MLSHEGCTTFDSVQYFGDKTIVFDVLVESTEKKSKREPHSMPLKDRIIYCS